MPSPPSAGLPPSAREQTRVMWFPTAMWKCADPKIPQLTRLDICCRSRFCLFLDGGWGRSNDVLEALAPTPGATTCTNHYAQLIKNSDACSERLLEPCICAAKRTRLCWGSLLLLHSCCHCSSAIFLGPAPKITSTAVSSKTQILHLQHDAHLLPLCCGAGAGALFPRPPAAPPRPERPDALAPPPPRADIKAGVRTSFVSPDAYCARVKLGG